MTSPSPLQPLRQGTDIFKGGYKTKIHALEHCPICRRNHKEDIDRHIVEYRWSSRLISAELKKRFPQCSIPSDRAIDNYRKHYLPNEPGRVSSSKLTDEIIAQVKANFDVVLEGIRQYSQIDQRVQKAIAAEHESGKWAYSANTDALMNMRFTMWKELLQQFADLGIPKEPASNVINAVNVQITNAEYDPNKVQSVVLGVLRGVETARDAERRGIPPGLPAHPGSVESPSPPEP